MIWFKALPFNGEDGGAFWFWNAVNISPYKGLTHETDRKAPSKPGGQGIRRFLVLVEPTQRPKVYHFCNGSPPDIKAVIWGHFILICPIEQILCENRSIFVRALV